MHKSIMTKLWGAALLVAVLSFSACLKDKGYEDGEYGTITGRTTGKKFISIPVAANKPNVIGVESAPGFQDVNLFKFSYDNETPAATNMSVTVKLNNDLIKAFDSTIIILPASAYQIVSLSTPINAGQVLSETFKIKLNTNVLDPTKRYGIGFSITEVPSGIQVSKNLSDAMFVFTIKNKYDGIYQFRARIDHPADRSAAWPRTPWTYGFDIHLITTGPSSVRMFNTAFNAGFHPLITPGASGFGGTEPNFVFNASDQLVEVFNSVAGTRSFVLNTAVAGSKFENVGGVKKVYAAFFMKQTGFIDMPIYDTLTFIKPRP